MRPSFFALSACLLLAAMTPSMGAPDALSQKMALEQNTAPMRLAQLFNRPTSTPPAEADDNNDEEPPARQRGQDSGALVVRIDRLENQLRALTGQIEQLQFQIKRLEDARAAAISVPPPQQPTPTPVNPTQTAPASVPAMPPAIDPTNGRRRRGDAFDPSTDPNAPGAPRTLGATAASQPIAASNAAPAANAAPGAVRTIPLSQPSPTMKPVDLSPPGASPENLGAIQTSPSGTAIAANRPPTMQEEFDLANAYLKQGQYETAEKSYAAFLTKHPDSRLSPSVIFNLGESYFKRNRYREAAEQYLKIRTTYPNSANGAQALLRLGQSLHVIDPSAKEQACVSFSEIAVKYPGATATIRAAEKEAKRIQC